MTGTIFEEANNSGTFAEELGVEDTAKPAEEFPEEGLTVEEYEKAEKDASAELQWGNAVPVTPPSQENSLTGRVAESYDKMTIALERVAQALASQTAAFEVLLQAIEHRLLADDNMEDEIEDEEEDLVDYQPKKKGSPGRPAKEPPKTVIPKKQKAKTPAKKAIAAKPKALRQKTKRR